MKVAAGSCDVAIAKLLLRHGLMLVLLSPGALKSSSTVREHSSSNDFVLGVPLALTENLY